MNEQEAVQAHALSLEDIDQQMSIFLSLVVRNWKATHAMKSTIWLATNLLTDALP